MNSISTEILEKYQIRKSKKQKTAFIEFLRAHFPELKVEESLFGVSRNIVIGNPSTAKAVLTAHYDTCARMFVPNFIMPQRPALSFGYGFLIAVPMVLISLAIGALVGRIAEDGALGSAAYIVLLWFMLIMMLFGPANRHTANDNTSGVITLAELLSTMSPEERAQTCFVFFDNEEKGLLGSSFFAKEHKAEMEEKLLINFDCVSDGDYLMLILSKKAFSEHAESLKAAFADVTEKTVLVESGKGIYYPSDQKNFKKNIGVASFKKSKFGLYMNRIHTDKDTVTDERNIAVLTFGIRKFLGSIIQ